MKKNIKILVGYHKPSYLFKNDIFVPIHAGRAVSNIESKDGISTDKDTKWLLKNTIGDDTGDNISKKNREFCECTVLYWAWKNYNKLGNPDYIGFMQYRRHFILKDNIFETKDLDQYEKAYATRRIIYPCKNYEQIIGIDKKNMNLLLDTYGGIYTNPCNLRIVNIKNLRDDYSLKIPGVNVKDFDIMIDIVTKMYPDMADYIRTRVTQPLKSCFQMWILPKNIFFEYMEFLFSVLFQCEKNIDTTDYSINGKRTLGYLGELLFDFYMNFNKEKYNLHSVNVCEIKYIIPDDCINKNILFYIYMYIKQKIRICFNNSNIKTAKEQKNYYKSIIKILFYRKKIGEKICL